MDLHAHHDSTIDVTGGIALKAARAGAISEVVEDVWFVNGEHQIGRASCRERV